MNVCIVTFIATRWHLQVVKGHLMILHYHIQNVYERSEGLFREVKAVVNDIPTRSQLTP